MRPRKLVVCLVEDRDRLVVQWQGLVKHVAARYRNHPSIRNVDLDDVIQNGAFGLLSAASQWRRDGGASFKTFAYNAIMFQILNRSRGGGVIGMPRHAVLPSAKPKYRAAALLAQKVVPFSIEEQEPRSRDDPYGQIEHRDECEALAKAFERLPWRERKVLRMRFWEGRKLCEVGLALRLTRERVRQIEGEAIQRLRGMMA